MRKYFKRFDEFVTENLSKSYRMKFNEPIDVDPETNKKPIDKKLEDEVLDDMDDNDSTCPRCGKVFGECECPEKDSMDTNTASRFKGKIKTK